METIPLNLTGILTQKFTPITQGSEQSNLRRKANRKSLTNNGKTKNQSPNERKGGSLRNNAK